MRERVRAAIQQAQKRGVIGMGRGRPPKPTALKALHSRAPEAAHFKRQIIPTASGALGPPLWLTAEQRDAWDYYVANAPAGVLKNVDRGALMVYVVAEDTYRRASIAAQDSSIIGVTSGYLTKAAQQAALMFRAASELGFTPVSRARLEAANPPEAAEGWEDVA